MGINAYMDFPLFPKLFSMRSGRIWLFLFTVCCLPGTWKLYAQPKLRAADTVAVLQMLGKGDSLSSIQPEEARGYFSRALLKSREVGYHKGTVMALTKTGNWYFGNDMNLAIQYGRQALQLYEEKEMADMNIKAPLDLLLAEAYDEKGITDSAACFYYLLTEEMEGRQRTNANFTTNMYIKLAVFWIHLNYDSASTRNTLKLYIDRARSAAEGLPESSAAKRNIYFLQALSFQATQEFDSSRRYFELFLEKSPNLGMPRKMSVLLNIASTWLYLKRPDKALGYIEQMEELAQKPGHEAATAYFINEARYLTAYAWYIQERYTSAIALLQQYLTQSEGKGKQLRYEMLDAHRMLSNSYERMGMYKEALAESKIQKRQQDSLSRRDKLDMVNRLEMRYRTVQKNKVLALQKLTIEEERNKVRRRNFWIGIVSLLAVALTMIGLLLQRSSRNKQKLQAEKLGSIQKEMEIARLQATVTGEERERRRLARELHDGVGGILAVARISLGLYAQKQPVAVTEDFAEGMKLMEEAATELRQTAHNMLPDVLENKGLVPAIRSFVYKAGVQQATELVVQSYGTEQRFGITFELAVYRIVQELVQNIVKHAMALKALIQIEFVPEGLAITIEDDGIGMSHGLQTASEGDGFVSIYERVRAAGGTIDIESSPGKGTSIYLEFVVHAEA